MLPPLSCSATYKRVCPDSPLMSVTLIRSTLTMAAEVDLYPPVDGQGDVLWRDVAMHDAAASARPKLGLHAGRRGPGDDPCGGDQTEAAGRAWRRHALPCAWPHDIRTRTGPRSPMPDRGCRLVPAAPVRVATFSCCVSDAMRLVEEHVTEGDVLRDATGASLSGRRLTVARAQPRPKISPRLTSAMSSNGPMTSRLEITLRPPTRAGASDHRNHDYESAPKARRVFSREARSSII